MAWRPTLLRVMYLVTTSTNARSNIKKRPKHRRIERGFSDERGQRCGDRAAQNRIFRAKPDCRLFARGILGRTDSRNKRGGFVPRARKTIPPDFVISRCGKHDPTRSATVRLIETLEKLREPMGLEMPLC